MRIPLRSSFKWVSSWLCFSWVRPPSRRMPVCKAFSGKISPNRKTFSGHNFRIWECRLWWVAPYRLNHLEFQDCLHNLHLDQDCKKVRAFLFSTSRIFALVAFVGPFLGLMDCLAHWKAQQKPLDPQLLEKLTNNSDSYWMGQRHRASRVQDTEFKWVYRVHNPLSSSRLLCSHRVFSSHGPCHLSYEAKAKWRLQSSKLGQPTTTCGWGFELPRCIFGLGR